MVISKLDAHKNYKFYIDKEVFLYSHIEDGHSKKYILPNDNIHPDFVENIPYELTEELDVYYDAVVYIHPAGQD